MSVTYTPRLPAGSPDTTTITERECTLCVDGGEFCGYCDRGIETVVSHPWPHVNLANANALNMHRAIGLPADLWGEIDARDVAAVLCDVESTLEDTPDALVARAELHREASTHPRVIDPGTGDEYARDRLTRMRDLLSWCVRHNAGLVWS